MVCRFVKAFYVPNEFVFNFVPFLKYPLKAPEGLIWNKEKTRQFFEQYRQVSQKHERGVLVGEFGVNVRQGLYGEEKWVKDCLSCFKELGFHWTYWTYKALKYWVSPDGIYSYVQNPKWVNRLGPLMGWETYHIHWPADKEAMIRSWHTDQFVLNKEILKALNP